MRRTMPIMLVVIAVLLTACQGATLEEEQTYQCDWLIETSKELNRDLAAIAYLQSKQWEGEDHRAQILRTKQAYNQLAAEYNEAVRSVGDCDVPGEYLLYDMEVRR